MKKIRLKIKYFLFSIIYSSFSFFFKKQEFLENYIISLTSTRERFAYILPTLESLSNQTQPLNVVLTLNESDKDFLDLNQVKAMFAQNRLEIIWDHRQLRSYNKLIPASELYPTKNIITVDDDVVYNPKMIEQLIIVSEAHQNTIIANLCRIVGVSGNTLQPYNQWGISRDVGYDTRNLAIGCGGVLYPRKFVEKLAGNSVLKHIALAPKQDDIFFFAFAKKYKFDVYNLANWRLVEVPVFEQLDSLKLVNLNSSENVDALTRLSEAMDFTIDV